MIEDSITHGRILKIAIPIMLANIAIPLIGVVDTAVVGQIPHAEPIAAVGIGSVVLSAIYWVFGFLRMGTAGLTAQAEGAKDRGEVVALLTRSLMIGGAGGLAIIALLQPLLALAFSFSPVDAEVEELARSYMQIRIWSAPSAIAMFGILGWLIARERSRSVLVLQLCVTSVNVILDLVFVTGFGWGVQGVAVASFIAEWSGLALGLWLCRNALRHPSARDWPRIFNATALRRMAVVNTDILIRSLMLEAIFLSFVFYYSAGLGTDTLAANQVLMQFIHFIAYALDGFAFAAEALVGQAVGAKSLSDLRKSVWLSSAWGLATSFAYVLVFWSAGAAIIVLITKDPSVQQIASTYLPWIILVPIISYPSFMLDGIFIGATRTRDMRNMMMISAAVFFAAVFILMPQWGNHGLWAALMISFVARAVTLGFRYPSLERAATA
ncbi:MATE family efflux transporter [Tropicibacter sp. R15_0]|uniref:MATE family efflux transporter n=1 Tax=Tropicibacter sp. R15_0 TaxID=2821101 RepID=UPI001ADBC4EB|nr:MATE family efflux transporter [Tropicibacter sp. R15_0]MBO9467416.1 MATE family efflux transporter [Tropicibacter sp. R15_0]